MKVYLNTSFLRSLYRPDVNSVRAAEAMQKPENTYLVSTLTESETVNALELRVFRKEIVPVQGKYSSREFEKDLREVFSSLFDYRKRLFTGPKKFRVVQPRVWDAYGRASTCSSCGRTAS